MSEEFVARKIGGKLVKNSGRGKLKGDMRWRRYAVDIKEGASFSLTEKSWGKVCTDALSHGIDWEPMILRVLPSGAMIACIEFSTLEELENKGEGNS